MKRWVIKAVVQKVIAALPASHRVNFLFQKYVTRGVKLSPAYLADKLDHSWHHLRYARDRGLPANFHALELGTGWYPIVPISLWLAGAERVVSLDLHPLLKAPAIAATADRLLEQWQAKKRENFRNFWHLDRLERLEAWRRSGLEAEQLMREMGIEYRVGDARQMQEGEDSFDLVVSNNVLEHVSAEVMRDILTEFRRVLKPTGVHSHFIDMSDHFAHLDNSITIYNFLRFSSRQWKMLDNAVQPQNRWRLSDYLNLFQDLGWRPEQKRLREGNMEALQGIKLAPEFRAKDPVDLAASHVHLVHLNRQANG